MVRMKMIKLFDEKLLNFLLVGMINTAIGAAVMFLLYNLVHCSYWFSSFCNYLVGGIISFFLNKYFTFNDSKKSFLQIILFILNIALCYFIAYIFAKWAIYCILPNKDLYIKDNISMIAGMFIFTGLNYLIQRLIIFNKGETK